jgi:hypothetical protein
MPYQEVVVRRLLLSVDARRYGAAPARRHPEIQGGLLKVLDEAARESGLTRSEWNRQPAGDGELAVLPPGESEPRVVERFPQELRNALRRHNRDLNDAARLRLRLAVHFGAAAPGPNGNTGPGPVTVSRLCDSEQLKQALVAANADLAVIISRQIYDDVIRQEFTLLTPAELRQVTVRNKEFAEDAWIWIPGHAAPPPSPEGPGESAAPPSPASGPGSVPGPPDGSACSPRSRRDVFDGAVVSAHGPQQQGPALHA